MIYCWLSFWIVSFLYCILWLTVDCLSGLWVFCTVFHDLLLIVILDCEFFVLYFMIYCWLSFLIVSFLYCILWFTVDCLSGLWVFVVYFMIYCWLFFRTESFCPCPSYFYFSIVFLVIHVIKAINRGLGKLLKLLFIFQVFYWQKLKNIKLKIQQANKIWMIKIINTN